jgi:hypothetical protein
MPDRRSELELLRTFKAFLAQSSEKEFYKSDLRHPPWNINPDTVEKLVKLVAFCQHELPPIEVLTIKRNVFIRIVEQKSVTD